MFVLALIALFGEANAQLIDPSNYTCMMFVSDKEALGDSFIVQALLRRAENRWKNEVSSAESRLPANWSKTSGEEADRGLIHSGAERPGEHHADSAFDNSKNSDSWFRLVNNKAVEECSQETHYYNEGQRYINHGISKLKHSGRHLLEGKAKDPEPDSSGVKHAGVQCLKACGGKGGNCSTGYCGSGYCCKHNADDAGCLQNGCSDRHCCIKKPMDARTMFTSNVFCRARPGHFCLSTIAEGYTAGFSAVQICALQRTIVPCPAGYYCKGTSHPPRACSEGHYCPTQSSENKCCLAAHFCPFPIAQKECPPGTYCGECWPKPASCPAGQYCPDGLNYTCPAGSFCPEMITHPIACTPWARCPEGSFFQDWTHIARLMLLVGIVVWVMTVTSVSKWLTSDPGPCSRLPIMVPVFCIALGWILYMDWLSHLAPLFGFDEGKAKFETWFGAGLHRRCLVFCTVVLQFLWCGSQLLTKLPKNWRSTGDGLLGCVLLAELAASQRNIWAGVFLINLTSAFYIIWTILSQQGPLHLRIGLLMVGVVALAIQFFLIRANELAYLLGAAMAAFAAKELGFGLLGGVRLLARNRRRFVAESSLDDARVRPLMGSLAVESLATPVKDIVTAACVTAGARASLAAHGLSKALPEAMDPEKWDPWIEHRHVFGPTKTSSGLIDPPTTVEPAGFHSVSYELSDVSYLIDDRRKLLHDLSFVVPAGSSVAVMGASGAGKTTLLSVLSGRCGDGRFQGSMAINGVVRLPWQMAEIRPLMGYVPQDDVMHTSLTVRENCTYQAALRATELSSEAVGEDATAILRDRVETVLSGLGLAAVADRTVSSGLSGGQRKRVSIGMELVASPRVLFLDEPTTGLDSSTAHRIVDMVLGEAKLNRCTSFATIHQPRWPTLSLFDMLVLLAPGGYLCYAGPVSAMQGYFKEVLHVDFKEDENPADTCIDVCTFESARSLAVDGIWRSPPQCLRAVLFPTPDAADDEADAVTPWQPDELGHILQSLWNDFFRSMSNEVARRHPRTSVHIEEPEPKSPGRIPLPSTLSDEAQAKLVSMVWGRQVWLHLQRSLLVLSRDLFPTVAAHMGLLFIAMKALAWAYPRPGFGRFFLQNGLFLLLFGLAQSVTAQRLFGGEERAVALREASLSSLQQVLHTFIGKDISSFFEITLAAMVFTLTFWPDSKTYALFPDIFEISFALLYALWGLNHILAICFRPSTAILCGIVLAFLSFLCAGLRPRGPDLANSLGGYGIIFLLVSPMRWALTQLITWNVLRGVSYLEPVSLQFGEKIWAERGFSLRNFHCLDTGNIKDCWSGTTSWATHSGQLLLLGLLFRLLAIVALLITSASHANGGQLLLGAKSISMSRWIRDTLLIFIVFFTLLNVYILGFTN